MQISSENEAVKSLSALAHPVRLQVFWALVVAGQSGLTPGVMQEGLGMAASSLSFHLKELSAAGLVSVERSSRSLIYRAAFQQMNALIACLTENCCQAMPCTADRRSMTSSSRSPALQR